MNAKKKQSHPPIEWPKIDVSTFQDDLDTYIWKLYSEENKFYAACINNNPKKNQEVPKNMFSKECIEIKLYNGRDEDPSLRIKFKKDLFRSHIPDGPTELLTRFSRVVIPTEVYQDIIDVICKYKLESIHDIIIETLAITQDFFLFMTDSWDKANDKYSYRNTKIECDKLIRLIELFDKSRDFSERQRPSFKSISFKINKETIKLEDGRFIREFVNAMKEYYKNLNPPDWKQNIKNIAEEIKLGESEQKFKYSNVISYYNLLTRHGGFTNTKIKPTPNPLMLCIAKLLKHAYVIDATDSDDVITKTARNYYIRGKLQGL